VTNPPLAASAGRAGASIRISRPPAGVSAECARALEAAVLDALAGATGTFDVQFGTWPGEDGRVQFVCRVEEPPADPFGGQIQWRWWSALFDDAEALRASLSAAVGARARVRSDLRPTA